MLTTVQVQKELGVSRQTLYAWRKMGIVEVGKRPDGRLAWNDEAVAELRDRMGSDGQLRTAKTTKPFFEIQNRRYLGSKEKLLPFIHKVVSVHTRNIDSVADIFAGTGVVADMFAEDGKKVIVNDILHSNNRIYHVFFGREPVNWRRIESALKVMNRIRDYGDGYLERAYGGRYFSTDNANAIGSARQWVEDHRDQFNEREYDVLIASILYACDKVANTVGHYDSYRRKMDSFSKVVFRKPLIHRHYDCRIFEEDANALVRRIRTDLVYIDTPYNSRQYVDTYHVLENISDWHKPRLVGVARKSIDRGDRKSLYNLTSAPQAFSDLIGHISARYILVSYNNMAHKGVGRSNAKISHEEIMETLSRRGKVQVFAQDFKPFSSGRSDIRDNQELLYLVKVKK